MFFMKKVGQILADERKRRRIPITEISQSSKIKTSFLEAIERNEFGSLPPSAFVRGFLKTYAEAVGLDATTILALFRRDYKVNDQGEVIPREFLNPVYRKKTLLSPKLTTALTVMAVLIMIGSYVGWQWYQLQQPPMLQVDRPLDLEIVSKQIIIEGKTESDAVVFVNSNPVSVSADGFFKTQIYFDDLGDHTITLKAEDRNMRATTLQRTVTVSE